MPKPNDKPINYFKDLGILVELFNNRASLPNRTREIQK